jgi:hypothetical protein
VLLVSGGKVNVLSADYTPPTMLVEKGTSEEITQRVIMYEDICAPISKGDKVGRVDVYRGDVLMTTVDITACDEIPRITYMEFLITILSQIVGFI